MNWHDLLLAAGGYAAGIGSCLLAVWLGDRLRERSQVGNMYDEQDTEAMRRNYEMQAQALGPLAHFGRDGAMHRGHVRDCTLCRKIKARQG